MDAEICTKQKKSLRLPQTRPSLLDPRLRVEPWVSACSHAGLLVIYLNNHPVTLLPGSSLELASLNQILFTLRHRYPRAQKRTSACAVSNAFENPQ